MGQWPWNVWFHGYLRLREEIGSAWRCKSELPKKLTLNKLALIGEAEKSP